MPIRCPSRYWGRGSLFIVITETMDRHRFVIRLVSGVTNRR